MQLGFSLIEVLIFLTILSLVFITAAAVATVSIQNSKSAEHRLLAARYGQELMDWLHGQKETGWDAFLTAYNLSINNQTSTYCFNTEPVTDNTEVAGPCNDYMSINGTASIYQREVVFIYDPSFNKITVKVNVKWAEGGNTLNTPINSVFAPFE